MPKMSRRGADKSCSSLCRGTRQLQDAGIIRREREREKDFFTLSSQKKCLSLARLCTTYHHFGTVIQGCGLSQSASQQKDFSPRPREDPESEAAGRPGSDVTGYTSLFRHSLKATNVALLIDGFLERLWVDCGSDPIIRAPPSRSQQRPKP